MSEKLRETDITGTDGINLFYRVTSLFMAREIENFFPKKPLKTENSVYYKSTGVFVARNEKLTLAVKMGGNGDSHNHNDTGSFTVYAKGKPVFIDLGVETYSKKTFSADRYTIWTMQSSFHNLPEINSFSQHDGEEYHATDVEVTAASIKANIAAAYPAKANIKSYVREISLEDDCFNLVDTFDENADVCLNLMTATEPFVKEGKIVLGDIAMIERENSPFILGEELEIEAVEIADERLFAVWGSKVYRTRLHSTRGCIALRCRLI